MNEEEFLNEQLRVLGRKLKRLQSKAQDIEMKFRGGGGNFTFHEGLDLGNLLGRVAVLEDIIDSLEDRVLPYKQERLRELRKDLNNI